MIDDLLDFTRSRLGRGMPIVPQPMDLESVCRDVVSQFQAVEPRRQLRFESSGGTTGQWDPERLRQVVSNLIANAIEHGAEDSSIDVSVTTEGPDVLLTVTNQGKPIPADVLPRLFDPLVRGASRSDNSHRHGSIGLGLYIVSGGGQGARRFDRGHLVGVRGHRVQGTPAKAGGGAGRVRFEYPR
jgi:signal transduction histidine kinase